MFANYTQGYDIQLPVGLSQEVISEKTPIGVPAKSLKSIRDYKWGMVFGDKYGRETPVFSSGYTTGYTDNYTSLTGDISLSKEFSSTKNYFRIKQRWDNPVNDNNEPPEWADYVKYYVKETSNEYYNLVLNRWYRADEKGSTVWLSFSSADRNKVDEETYLILKTKNGTAEPVKEEARYKIIAIESNAPDFIKTKHNDIGTVRALPGDGQTGVSIWEDAAADVTTTEPITLLDDSTKSIQIDIVQWDGLFGMGVNSSDDRPKTERSKLSVQICGTDATGVKKYSKWNEVTNWKQRGSGSTSNNGVSAGGDFVFFYAESFGPDANMHARFVADTSLDYGGGTVTGLRYDLHFKEETIENKPEFDGRFFVKVEADPVLESKVLLSSEEYEEYVNLGIFNLDYIAGQDANPADSGTYQGTSWVYGQGDGWWYNSFNMVSGWTSLENGGSDPAWDDDQCEGWGCDYDGPISPSWGDDEPGSVVKFSRNTIQDNFIFASNSNPGLGGDNCIIGIPSKLEHGFSYYSFKSLMQNFWSARKSSVNSRPFIDQARSQAKDHYGLSVGEISQNLATGLGLGSTTPSNGLGRMEIAVVGYSSYDSMEPSDSYFMQEMSTLGTHFSFVSDPDNIYRVIAVDDYNNIRNLLYWDGGTFMGEIKSMSTFSGNNARMGFQIDFRRVDTTNNSLTNEGVITTSYDPRGEVRHDGTMSLQVQILRHQNIGGRQLIFDSDHAILETEPKEDVDLDIYYEASSSIPLFLNENNINNFIPINCSISNERPSTIGVEKVTLPGSGINKVSNTIAKPLLLNSELPDPIVNLKVDTDGTETDLVNGVYIGDELIFHHEDGIKTRLKVTDFVEQLSTATSTDPGVVDDEEFEVIPKYTPVQRRTLSIQANPDTTNTGDWDPATYGAGNAWDPAVGEYLLKVTFYQEDITPGTVADISVGAQVLGFKEVDSSGNDTLTDPVQGVAPPGIVVAGISDNNVVLTLTSATDKPFYYQDENGDLQTWTEFQSGGVMGRRFQITIVDKPTGYYSVDKNAWKYPVDLSWFNCYSFGNGAESDRIRDDFNAPQINNGVTVSTTFSGYRKENKTSGLIYSGIYNSTSEMNNLNEFNMSQDITKDLNPSYGSIQRLKTRDTDVIVLTEDKVLKVLSSKDAIFNADGSSGLTATKKVLGTAIPFVGDYGISKNPESLASDQYRMYFTDKQRGAVLRLSQDGLTPISNVGMKSWFREHLRKNDKALGTFDVVSGEYNLTLTKNNPAYGFTDEDWICYANRYEDLLAAYGYDIDGLRNHYIVYGVNEGRIVSCDGTETSSITVSFSEESKGWVSFKTFLPEAGGSVSGQYITAKGNGVYQHYTNSLYNCFYGVDPSTDQSYESSISVLFNDVPGSIKSFNSFSYEGSQSKVIQNTSDTKEFYNLQSKSGWYVNSFETDKQSGSIPEFIEKEGKWYNKINGTTTTLTNLDTGEFTVQGIGNPSIVSSVYL